MSSDNNFSVPSWLLGNVRVNPISTPSAPPPGFSDIPTAHASAFQTYTTMGTKSYEIQIKSKLNFHPATISGEKDFSFFELLIFASL